jgi:hypothetical protein
MIDEYRIFHSGVYELKFVVFADNFRKADASFILKVGENMNVISLREQLGKGIFSGPPSSFPAEVSLIR